MKSTKIIVLVCAVALAARSHAQNFTHTFSGIGNVPIPASGTGGAAGGISNPANAASFTLNVPDAFVVEHLTINVNLSHPSVSDLRIDIAHCGVVAGLHNQQPPISAYVAGTYGFDDSAPTSFASAIAAAGPNGTVAPGTYQPSGSASAFNGMSAAGPWTVTVYDLVAGNLGGLFGLSLTLSGASTYQSAPTFGYIPDGLNGQCLDPVLRQVDVGTHRVVSDVAVQIFLAHTYVSDLDITLQHGAVSVALSEWSAPSSSADVNGGYTFWDGSPFVWATAETNNAGGMIPTGVYRPKNPLSAFAGLDQFGPWYVTVCDRAGADVGTLGGIALQITHSVYDMTLSQPSGPASIVVTNSGGAPGHPFVNLFTLAQGSAPAGWILGLDIPLIDLMSQVSFGPPFTGTLGSCGYNFLTIGGPIPSGLTLWGVSIELDGTMTPVATKSVFNYTTL